MLTKDQSLVEIERLIAKYVSLGPGANKLTEEETKKDFLLPLFKALNWNTEDSREVSAEETISKKRVDYGFRINGIPKFFLEAKAIKETLDEEHAKQSVNYSWLKSTTWALLSNFVQLEVYNSEWKSRSVLEKRFFTLRFDEFVPKFDKLWLLSRDAFSTGDLDRTAEEWGKKQKRVPVSPVTEQLFVDLISWRQRLTRKIAEKKSNMNVIKSDEVLDECVQRILDRVIFIRVCEDKQLEPNTLLSRLREWKGSGRTKSFYRLLVDVFHEFDVNYNSKLFDHHTADELDVDDVVLSFMINELYENKEAGLGYDFSAIDADVLGSIYEQYLGYILEKHKKKAEVVKDVWKRKSMGIFYTPTYVVDYIVRNTVEIALKESKGNAIRVLDPACGSGSFLGRAFTSLTQTNGNVSSDQKMRTLTNSIYGVDLDPKAAEIAQLDLLLKVLDRRQILPVLTYNIKVGNSLVDDKNIDPLAFDWAHEFKDVLSKSPFDVVIGNPPYVESRDIPDTEWDFYREHYSSAYKRFDLSVLFIERAVSLLRDGGRLGFIISNKFAASDYGYGVRKFILDNCAIEQIIDVSNIQVFRDASTYPYIIILRKERSQKERVTNRIRVMKVSNEEELHNPQVIYEIEQASFHDSPSLIFSIELTREVKRVVDKIVTDSEPLESICEMKDGIHTGNIKEKLIVEKKVDSSCRKMITAESIDRYDVKWDGLWVRYNPDLIDSKKGEYGSLRDERIFIAKEKLMTALFGLRLEVAYDDEQLYANNSVKIILPLKPDINLRYVLACLNSKLLAFYHRTYFAPTHVRGGYMQFYPQDILRLPIKKASGVQIEKLVSLVHKMLELNKQLQLESPLSDKSRQVEEELVKADAAIDKAVYDLYNLTDAEVKIVEEAVKES